MDEKSKHAGTSDHSRRLCDLMLASLPPDSAPNRNFTATWCGAYIQQRKAALYWVQHTKSQIQVFMRCEDTPEIRDEIDGLLPKGVTLKARPYPRAANWAKSMPLSLIIWTEEQARSMGPLLKLLSSSQLDPMGKSESTSSYWVPNSEIAAAQFEAAEEGAKTVVLINRYERNRKNRKLCLNVHGTSCSVCGFDFSATYGHIGKGYIHVHHLKPLKALGGESLKIDPIKDLRPVCPNCHEMLHQSDPPYTIETLKEIIASIRALARNQPKLD